MNALSHRQSRPDMVPTKHQKHASCFMLSRREGPRRNVETSRSCPDPNICGTAAPICFEVAARSVVNAALETADTMKRAPSKHKCKGDAIGCDVSRCGLRFPLLRAPNRSRRSARSPQSRLSRKNRRRWRRRRSLVCSSVVSHVIQQVVACRAAFAIRASGLAVAEITAEGSSSSWVREHAPTCRCEPASLRTAATKSATVAPNSA